MNYPCLAVFCTNTMYTTCWVQRYYSLFAPGLSKKCRSQTTLGRAGRRANRGSYSGSTSRGVAFPFGGGVWDHVVAMLSPCCADFFVIIFFRCSRSGVRVRSSWEKRVGTCWNIFLAWLPNLEDVLSNPDTSRTRSNSLGTPETFGLLTLIFRVSMEMGKYGSGC